MVTITQFHLLDGLTKVRNKKISDENFSSSVHISSSSNLKSVRLSSDHRWQAQRIQQTRHVAFSIRSVLSWPSIARHKQSQQEDKNIELKTQITQD